MSRKISKAAASGRSAQPQISAKLLEELIPGPAVHDLAREERMRCLDNLNVLLQKTLCNTLSPACELLQDIPQTYGPVAQGRLMARW